MVLGSIPGLDWFHSVGKMSHRMINLPISMIDLKTIKCNLYLSYFLCICSYLSNSAKYLNKFEID